MAYAFSVTHGETKKFFPAPPPAIGGDAVERAVASQFHIPFGTFGICSSVNGQAGYFHAGLQGDWDLVLIPGLFLIDLSTCLVGLFHLPLAPLSILQLTPLLQKFAIQA